MLKKASYIGYTAFLATGPALLTACSNAPVAEQPQDPSVLFSLSSDAMHFENHDGMNVTLVMEGVDPHTIWFTDRPTRESGAITTTKLAGEWSKGGTFDIDPPNAALVLHEPIKVDDAMADTLIAEVQDVGYDPANKTFRADLKVLLDEEAASTDGNLAAHGNRHDHAWPTHAGEVSLFIDSVSLDAVTAGSSPSPSPSTLKTQPNIKLCSSPSTCNNSTTANVTYNSTLYFQVTVTQSPASMEQPSAISAPVPVS